MIPHVMRPPVAPLQITAPTTQHTAIVLCGGGDPFAEYDQAVALATAAGRTTTIFAGNDMIEKCPHDIAHALSLHPDKLRLWLPRRKAAGFNDPEKIWAHRNYESIVTHWTRDWAGSTGLFCAKVARENGFTHVVLCGVPMTVEHGHFVRNQPWNAALAFRRGWIARLRELQPYLRSFNGWTKEQFGEPTEEWLRQDIEDQHRGTRPNLGGLRA